MKVSDDEDNFPEDPIYGYSRAQALDDEVLIQIPNRRTAKGNRGIAP
jgi:hypothetical protein